MRRFGSSWQRVIALKARSTDWARRRLEWLLRRLEPEPTTASWIRRVLFGAALVIGAWIGVTSLHFPGGLAVNALIGGLIAGLAFGLFSLIVELALPLLGVMERTWTRVGLVGAATLVFLSLSLGFPMLAALIIGTGLALAVTLTGVGFACFQRGRPWTGLITITPGLMVLVLALGWFHGSQDGHDPVAELVQTFDHDGQLWSELLKPGPYRVDVLTYGSGTDQYRPEFGAGVAWRSESVDARAMLGHPSGFGLRLREQWWGFGLDALPLNGRVWYPAEASGPLPLILVVHGNHDMMHFSDPGYAWLGEHLASRGHVVVSVDQNFLNGGVFGGVNRENATRGWLLLQHLAAWRGWQQGAIHPLATRVDLDQVILIGHSRGGEAVALAAAYNRLQRYPEDGRIPFDFEFGIQGVAAIAPVDGQFWTSGKPTDMDDVSYFVIHGGMDADVSTFDGDRQWIRTQPDLAAGRFSASLYLHHANHGQFNTVWGDNDRGGLGGRLLNRSWLMSGDQQRQAARLYLTAFAEYALARPDHMPELFCKPQAAGSLLPPTLYVSRCNDGRRVVLADFEQGLDLTRGSLPGVRIQGQDLDLWKEADVGFRGGRSRRQTGVFLGWHATADNGTGARATPSWRLEMNEDARTSLQPTADGIIWIDLAHADRNPPARLSDGSENESQDSPDADETVSAEVASRLRPSLVIEVELSDTRGNRHREPLDRFASLLPPLPVRHTRLDFINREQYKSPTEPVLQSVAIPLAGFAAAGIDLAALATIELHFANQEPGVLIVERIALE